MYGNEMNINLMTNIITTLGPWALETCEQSKSETEWIYNVIYTIDKKRLIVIDQRSRQSQN